MVALRFLAVLTVLAVAGAALGYLLTGDRRYFRFALQILKYAGLIALAILALFALEEIAVIL